MHIYGRRGHLSSAAEGIKHVNNVKNIVEYTVSVTSLHTTDTKTTKAQYLYVNTGFSAAIFEEVKHVGHFGADGSFQC